MNYSICDSDYRTLQPVAGVSPGMYQGCHQAWAIECYDFNLLVYLLLYLCLYLNLYDYLLYRQSIDDGIQK